MDHHVSEERAQGGIRAFLAQLWADGYTGESPEQEELLWQAFLGGIFEDGEPPEWDEEDA